MTSRGTSASSPRRGTRRPARQRGVGLIEVLVAVLILGFGLVAIALLQTSAIQNNFVSNQYTVAANLAQSLSEAMRSNQAGVEAGNYNLAAGTVPTAPSKDCGAATCSAAARAQWDLAIAYSAISSGTTYAKIPGGPTGLLPGGRLQVNCVDATCLDRSPRLITVYWDADRRGATGYNCRPGTSTDLKCFRLVHVP